MRRNINERQRSRSEQYRSDVHRAGPSTMPHILLPLLLLTLIVCGIESSRFGVVPPNVYTRLNNTFEVSCYVHGIDGVLNFYDGDTLVDESLIKRNNGTFITYKNVCPKAIKKNLTCKRGTNIVGTSEIFIDGRIEPVSNFECATKDLKHLSCGFKQSINIIPNSYKLYYSLNNSERKKHVELDPDFSGGYTSKKIKINKYDGSTVMRYNFSLVAKRMKISDEENLTEYFQMELLEILQPPPVEQIEVVTENSTVSNNAIVVLTLPRDLEKVTNHIMFNIRLKAKDENDSELTENILSDLRAEGKKVFVPLMDLKYANTFYQFNVRIKSKSSDEKEKKVWSEYVEKVFKTNPKKPEKLPHVCRNCFSIMDNGNIFVYWMEVPKFYQNADNFKYELRIKDERDKEIDRIKLQKTAYMIPNPFDKKVKVELFSVNALGTSSHHRTLYVQNEESKSHLRIKKELLNDFGYKLSWKVKDSNINDIESYTVIWCKQRNELPNQCDGPITFQNIPHDQTNFFLNTSHLFQLGVAINRASNLTGFEWAKCTASSPDEIGKIPSVWDDGNIKDTSIEIAWNLNCPDQFIVKSYNISYCVASNLTECEEPPNFHIINVDDKEEINKHRLTSLKPYTKYIISVAMISISNRMGPFSKPILVRSMEGTPSAPRNLTAIEIKETSVDLMWRRPIEINGPSLTYQLWCNEIAYHIDNNETMNETFFYTLNNLEPFTSYSIRVIAQTRNNSDPSEGLVISTKVGMPSRVDLPLLHDLRNGSLKLEWEPPRRLGGHLDFYHLNVTIHKHNTFPRNYSLYRISGRRSSCLINFGENDDQEVHFYIRAVNINADKLSLPSATRESIYCFENKETNVIDDFYYYGEWSPPKIHLSFYTEMVNSLYSSSTVVVITVCFGLTVFALFAYCILKFYQMIQKMKDIKAIYPEGLNPYEPQINIQVNREDNINKIDLLRDHVLTDIEEEEVTHENIEKGYETVTQNILREPLMNSSQLSDESVCNSFLIINNKPISLPTSPIQAPLLWKSNSIDRSYTKMHKPRMAIKNDNTIPIEGYLDMSGKSPVRNSTSIEVKNLLENSKRNNGYIDRKSIQKIPFPMNVNSNGYIAFKKN